MKVLITGASGFLGRAVLKQLNNAGYSTRAVIRTINEKAAPPDLNIEIIKGDILDQQTVEKAVDGCNIILHLASVYAFYPWRAKEIKELYKINVAGTENLLNAALKYKIDKFIYTSSIATIGKRMDGKPSNEETAFNLWHKASHYARSKLLAERKVLNFCTKGLPAVVLNPAVVIGEGDYKPTPSGQIIAGFLNRSYFSYYDAVLSFVDVDDVAKAHISAIKKGRTGERYILCNNEYYSLAEVFKMLEEISGVRAPRIRIAYPLLLGLVYFEELLSYYLLKKKPIMPSEGVKFCRMSITLDNSKAVRELGFTTTPIRETLAKAVNWYRENGYIKNA